MDLSGYTSNNSENHFLMSKIPQICMDEPCVLGVDEAGRGPVLGPMVYGISFCPISKNKDLKELGVDDSKALTEVQREAILKKVLDNDDYIGWAINILSPRHISTSMYRRTKYNLNEISHDSAINLIRRAVDAGVRVAEVYVDTVGPPEKYEAKLQRIFPEIAVTVAKKADSLYPCVSAASICAKVARDKILNVWEFPEKDVITTTTSGSGYPGDAVTKKFLRDNLNPVFGFPSLVRFSWKTAGSLLDEKGIPVVFQEFDPEEDPEVKKNPSIKNFFVAQPSDKKENKNPNLSRAPYFRDLKLETASINSFLKRN